MASVVTSALLTLGASSSVALSGGIIAGVLTTSAIGAALLGLAANALKPDIPSFKQQEIKRQLRFPTARPPKRHVYGLTSAPGTPVPWPIVGPYAYAAWVVNSRPSEGDFTVYLDNREVTLSGDPYDFSGNGGVATGQPFVNHVNIWIGRGDQTQPPQVFLDEAGWSEGEDELLWRDTDIGEGCTIVYARMHRGDIGGRNERWPSTIPQLDVVGKFTKVWDPRDEAQDAADPDTWEWSQNAALVGLDALMQNPIRPYPLALIDTGSFEEAADACDESVDLKSGGTESRYVLSGLVMYNGGELETIVAPILLSSGARFSRIGGKLGMVAAVPRDTSGAITTFFDAIGGSSILPDSERATEVRVSYTPAARRYDPAELEPYTIPGALAQDGAQPSVKSLDLSMCPSDGQAQRLQRIYANKVRLQARRQFTAPPSAIEFAEGSVVDLTLPAPYASLNGTFEITTIHPLVDPVGENAFAMRCPVELAQYSDAIYAWDETVDEVTIDHPDYNGERAGVEEPGALTVTDDDAQVGGSWVARKRLTFAPSATSGVLRYEAQWRPYDVSQGADENWQGSSSIDPDSLDGSGDVYGYVLGFDPTVANDFRVRTVSDRGTSPWVVAENIIHGVSLTGVAGTADAAHATFTGTSADSDLAVGVAVFRAEESASFNTAVEVGTKTVARNTAFSIDVGDATGVNLVSQGDFSSVGSWGPGGGWSIGSGVATHTPGGADDLTQAVSMSEGATYRVTLTVSGRTAGDLTVKLDGSTTVSAAAIDTNGTARIEITAPESPNALIITASSSFDGAIDDVWLVEDSASALPQGPGDFWVSVVLGSGTRINATGPITLNIP